ncbi:unnamed protein product [Lasius platythorax]|uniref:Uncharacterized protein n=1 Tax=Lasius platythorax TaxID=488582 RepID=A0AAV2P906_9HYME
MSMLPARPSTTKTAIVAHTRYSNAFSTSTGSAGRRIWLAFTTRRLIVINSFFLRATGITVYLARYRNAAPVSDTRVIAPANIESDSCDDEGGKKGRKTPYCWSLALEKCCCSSYGQGVK